jgi:hypothetical protein
LQEGVVLVKTDDKEKEEPEKKQPGNKAAADRDKDHPEERDEFNENHNYGGRDTYQQR